MRVGNALAVTLQDISAQKKHELELVHLASRDTLTPRMGLPCTVRPMSTSFTRPGFSRAVRTSSSRMPPGWL